MGGAHSFEYVGGHDPPCTVLNDMEDPALQDTIDRLAVPFLEQNGVELVELELSGSDRRRMLRFYVDRPGGITIGECARLSRGLEDLLDTHDPIKGSYVLEVSSPGLTRALKSDRDYERAIGKSVRLVLDKQGDLVGTLTSCDSAELAIDTGEKIHRIPRSSVVKANHHFEL